MIAPSSPAPEPERMAAIPASAKLFGGFGLLLVIGEQVLSPLPEFAAWPTLGGLALLMLAMLLTAGRALKLLFPPTPKAGRSYVAGTVSLLLVVAATVLLLRTKFALFVVPALAVYAAYLLYSGFAWLRNRTRKRGRDSRKYGLSHGE